jgi:NAD(P)-dependent dehydrogenase (short-subunit alcohol dehydrogenase family)
MATMREPRWAVVLGVSLGTGAAIARRVCEEPGLHVFGVHRGNHPDAAAEVEQAITAAGRRAHFLTAEAGTPEAAAAGARELLRVAGPRSVKLFVHSLASASVGALVSGPKRLEARQFHRTLDAMASSFVYWAQELSALDLLAEEAQLVGLSNPMTDIVMRNTALIAASKAALEQYVRHLAHELGPLGHRVNLVRFGAVTTCAARATFGDADWAVIERVLARGLPARRLSTAAEVADLVSVLASGSVAWMNGATIDFTGGEGQSYFQTLLDVVRSGAAKD